MKRLAFALVATIVLLPTFTTIMIVNLYTRQLTNPPCPGLFNSPADLELEYEEITLTAGDGVQVEAWYIKGQNDAVIVAVPGFNGNRSHALAEFGFLGSAGFGLLTFDQRHCSGDDIPQTLGYNEVRDMLAAVDYLSGRDGVAAIGAIGFSAGGVTTLLAAGEEPAIEAVVGIGGYHNLRADILDLGEQDKPGLYSQLLRRLIMIDFKRRTNVHPNQSSPIDVVAAISPRPLLLIYGEYEASSGELLYDAALEPKQLWLVAGADHGQYQSAAPIEYERRVVAFFQTHLLGQVGF